MRVQSSLAAPGSAAVAGLTQPRTSTPPKLREAKNLITRGRAGAGIRGALKPPWLKDLVGSSPTAPTMKFIKIITHLTIGLSLTTLGSAIFFLPTSDRYNKITYILGVILFIGLSVIMVTILNIASKSYR